MSLLSLHNLISPFLFASFFFFLHVVALVSLLASVLNLKTQLTDQKGSTLECYLEGYIKVII